MDRHQRLSVVGTAAQDTLEAISWLQGLSTQEFEADPDADDVVDWVMLNEHLESSIVEAVTLLIGSVRTVSDLLADDGLRTSLSAANDEPVVLAGRTADAVVEIVEALGYDRLRLLAGHADKVVERRSALDRRRLLSLDPRSVVACWDAVRRDLAAEPIDCRTLAVAIRKEIQRAERVALKLTPHQDQHRANSRRRRSRRSSPKKLTEIQRKTLEVVGDCKGNKSKAAKRLGKDRKTVVEAYEAALRILGLDPVTYGKTNKRTYYRDSRGQDDVADIDDQRRDVDQDQQRRYRKR